METNTKYMKGSNSASYTTKHNNKGKQRENGPTKQQRLATVEENILPPDINKQWQYEWQWLKQEQLQQKQ